MLAEVSTTQFSRKNSPETFAEHKNIAHQGGSVAKNARLDIEKGLGESVVSPLNAKDGVLLNDKE